MTQKGKETSFRSTFWTCPWKPESCVSKHENLGVKEEAGSAEKAMGLPFDHSSANKCIGDLSVDSRDCDCVSDFAFLWQVARTSSIWTSTSLWCGSGSSLGLLTLPPSWAWSETGCGWYRRRRRKRWGWGCTESAASKGLVLCSLKKYLEV